MPKIVNHEKQKERIAEAVWRVLQAKGFGQATLRTVAREAEIPESTMRYYFATQNELMLFSMNLINTRAAQRIEKLPTTDQPLEDAVTLLKELLPLRSQTYLEVHAWYVFLLKSLTDATLRPLAEEMQSGMYWFVWVVLDRLEQHKLLQAGVDKKSEAQHLRLFIDGIALNCLFTPTLKNEADKLVRERLASVCIT